MKRSKKRKLSRAIINTITYLMGVLFLVSLSALDSESALPVVAWIISGVYLGCYAWAKGYIERG